MDKKGNKGLDMLFISLAEEPGLGGLGFIFMELNVCDAAGEVGKP